MTLQQAQYFITIADEGTFSNAAKVLFVSQPSLSQFVKNLEANLGTTLFDRSTSPLCLTQTGQVYYNAAQKFKILEQELQKEMCDIDEKKAGTLVIGTTPFRAACMLPKSIAFFQEHFPGVKVEIITDTLEELNSKLRNNQIDLCIEINVFDPKYVIMEDLSPETMYLAVPPHHPFNEGRESQSLTAHDIKKNSSKLFDCTGISLEECKQLSFINLKSEDTFSNVTTKLCDVYHFQPHVVLTASTIEMLFHWVRFGIGVALLPDTLIKFGNFEEHPIYYKIQEPSHQIGLSNMSIVIAYKRDGYLSSAAKEYIHTLKKLIRLGTWHLNS